MASVKKRAGIKSPRRAFKFLPAESATHMAPSSSAAPDAAAKNVFIKMLPITLAVFISFLTIGLPLPVLHCTCATHWA
jgi:hypothetical protein